MCQQSEVHAAEVPEESSDIISEDWQRDDERTSQKVAGALTTGEKLECYLVADQICACKVMQTRKHHITV